MKYPKFQGKWHGWEGFWFCVWTTQMSLEVDFTRHPRMNGDYLEKEEIW